MAGDRNWSDVSFTPKGESTVLFGDVSIEFFGNLNSDKNHINNDCSQETNDPSLIAGTHHIRITSSNKAAIPEFAVNAGGTFQGKYINTQIWYASSNAKVYKSSLGVLVLESESIDGVASPLGMTVD